MHVIQSNYDIIFFGIIILSSVMALFKGAIAEIISLAVWISAFWFMRYFGNVIDARLPDSITNPILRSISVFIIFFIVFAIIATILKRLLSAIIKGIGLGGLNYMLGFLFGIARGILICAVIILLLEMFQLDPQHSWDKSKLSPVLVPTVHWIAKAIPKRLDNLGQH